MEEDIAVVGIGLRFPGEATSPSELWRVLETGQSQWSEFPEDRLNIDGYFHPGGDRQGSISFRGAHFLKGDMAAFDSPFFSIAAEDAKAIDPQQRMLLEVSYEALENAGIRKEDIDDSDTSVYVGSFVKDYEQICLRDPDWQPRYAATGNGIAIMANRISHFFNLHGPSMTLDTGCSGSLVSIHLAAQSLRSGESSLAIAAGSGMILTPNTIMPMTALNFLSPDGRCFTFDSRANGYGRGEGIGVVIMKRLSDAVQDNDTIRAVIRATAVNQDGRTPGITLPSKEAQVANIRAVYTSANLSFDQTAYVECHGTGTQAGDWRELKAISETLGSVRSVDKPIVVGSIKPNIGHLEGAAGVAGLIKGVLVLEKALIPPNINFEQGNPTIDFQDWRVKVPTTVMEWPLAGLRRVSINCFGFGGTNAHVIMDEAPAHLLAKKLLANHSSEDATTVMGPASPVIEGPQLLCYSSHEKSGVMRVVDSHVSHLIANDTCSGKHLRDYAYTLNCRRSNLEWRGFMVASCGDELDAAAKALSQSAIVRTSGNNKPRIGFIFCGQGAQWAQMGKDLLRYPAFSRSLVKASLYMSVELGAPFKLLNEISLGESKSRIAETHISQPATTAIQMALVDLMTSVGVVPRAVVGHSSGEIAAAYAMGALTQTQAWETAFYRGLAASNVSCCSPELKGAMMVVGVGLEETQTLIAEYGDKVQVACVNSPRSITISGDADAIAAVEKDLVKQDIFCRALNVKVAYHSRHMEAVQDQYRASLMCVEPLETCGAIAMFSSVTGQAVRGKDLDAAYWARNMVSPVQYVSAVEAMMSMPADQRPTLLVELSPRAALRSPTKDIVEAMDGVSMPEYHSILAPKTNGPGNMLKVIGRLWTLGVDIDYYKTLDTRKFGAPKCLTDLPTYPWNHSKSYWHESHLSLANRFRQFGRLDLIGAPTADSVAFEPRWRGFLRVSENPWIQDHQVQKTMVYPAAGLVSMVLEGARQMSHAATDMMGFEITNMSIEKALIIPNTGHGLEVAMNIKTQGDSDLVSTAREFAIYSKPLGHEWERNASGSLHFRATSSGWDALFAAHDGEHERLDSLCTETVNARQLYEFLDTVGINYGPLFQNMTDIRKAKTRGACVSKVRVPDTKAKMPAKFEYEHLMHPATLDAMFQTLFAIDSSPMVPTFIRSIFVSCDANQDGPEVLFDGYAKATRTGIRDADAFISMKRGSARVIVDGIHLTGLSNPSPAEGGFLPNHRNLCTQIVWQRDATFTASSTFTQQVAYMAHKWPALSVLQIGGSAATTCMTLKALGPGEADETARLARYTIIAATTTTPSEIDDLIYESPLRPFIEIKESLDQVSVDYHLILHFRHAGEPDKELLCEKHLKLGGILLTEDASLADGPRHNMLQLDCVAESEPPVFMTVQEKRQDHPEPTISIVVLLPNRPKQDAVYFIRELTQSASKTLPNVEISRASLRDVQNKPELVEGNLVVSLVDFADDGKTHGHSVYEWDQQDFDVFNIVHKTAKSIVWITHAAHMTPLNAEGAPVIALARTLMSEDPLKTIVTFDLDYESRINDAAVVNAIWSVVTSVIHAVPSAGPLETEYAEREGKIFIPRLTTVGPLNRLIENEEGNSGLSHKKFHDETTGLAMVISKAGIADGLRYYTEFQKTDLAPHQVEIALERTMLCHLDMDTVLGRTRESCLGMDVMGRVTRVGKGVGGHISVGSRVIGLATGGTMANLVRTNARFVSTKEPEVMRSTYLSAYYALVHMGRITGSRRVLIQAGATAYGLAAIDVALSRCAEIFATVFGAGADKQRAAIRKCGIDDDHIINADDGSLVQTVRAATRGDGVHIVFNPTQQHVQAGFDCVRRGGTIVQFANKAAAAHPPRTVHSSATLINFDLANMLADDSCLVAELLSKMDSAMYIKILAASPAYTANHAKFSIDHLGSALERLHQTPFLGAVFIDAPCDKDVEVPVLNKRLTKPLDQALDANATYLLAGGLGGLGRSISELLVRNGVRHLAYMSRSGAKSDKSQAFLASLQSRGIDARVYPVDLCDEAAVTNMMRGPVAADMPVIKGIFQCAAVIKDAVFDNMTFEDWTTAVYPKTIGTHNLVQAVPPGADPFFVFLASSAGVIGNRGQANYAAGNCYLDALAHKLRYQGRHAVSIDLGPVLGAGMLAEDEDILTMLRASGFYGIRHQDFLNVISHAITMEAAPGFNMPAQVALGVGTGGLLRQNNPADPYWSRTALYKYLNLIDMPAPNLAVSDSSAPDPSRRDLKTMLASCADAASAAEIIQAGLVNMLAKAMTMLPEELDVNKPPNAYGVDSLVAVGVRNFVINSFAVQVSVFEVLSDATIAELSLTIAEKGNYGADHAHSA